MSDNKERGIIVNKGLGGFLNPPTHPEHDYSVEYDLKRRPEDRGSMSLSYAVEKADYLTDETRTAAKRKLDSWVRPALESEEIQDWIAQVLGYFKNCYCDHGSQSEDRWNVGKLHGPKENNDIDDHAGVNLIWKYYPEFVPLEKHLNSAYWGKKPE